VKILYVVQRYGAEIVGGSESACREFAEHLVGLGHEVEVLTSCARDYVEWANYYPPGTEMINGVRVHRLHVRKKRVPHFFGRADQWLMNGSGRPADFEQRRWAQLMGPDLEGLRSWLVDNYKRFDVAVFMTYLYSTATLGMPVLAGRLPVVFQPTAHAEPALRVPYFQNLFRMPDAFLFFTPEERQIVREKFRIEPQGRISGIGIDIAPQTSSPIRFRERFGLGESRYLVYVGRLDPMKGVGELCRFFLESRSRIGHDLKLVLVGDALVDLPKSDDIIVTGYLEPEDKQAAIAGAMVLVQPSYFESFSIVLCEAWVQKKPALVQGQSAVLRGQAMRSGGAIPYEGWAEFDCALGMLLEDANLAQQIGENGYRYVVEKYDWRQVMKEFTASVEIAQEKFDHRTYNFSGHRSR
jgi:glycosyltransferase involved in cell wall biosynthesis